MKIYTKTGDQGETGLFGGKRIYKDEQRIKSYGAADQLNCSLGLALAEKDFPITLRDIFIRIQNELFLVGSELATPPDAKSPIELLDPSAVEQLEKEIDQMESKLPALQNFILPGGCRPGALLHQARTFCRHLETEVISLHRQENPQRQTLLMYVNRLSDFLFVAARFVNHELGHTETVWKAPRKS